MLKERKEEASTSNIFGFFYYYYFIFQNISWFLYSNPAKPRPPFISLIENKQQKKKNSHRQKKSDMPIQSSRLKHFVLFFNSWKNVRFVWIRLKTWQKQLPLLDDRWPYALEEILLFVYERERTGGSYSLRWEPLFVWPIVCYLSKGKMTDYARLQSHQRDPSFVNPPRMLTANSVEEKERQDSRDLGKERK